MIPMHKPKPQGVSLRSDTYLIQGKRVFIKDIIHYLLPPDGKPASIAPSLQRIKRGVGTNGQTTGEENGVAVGHADQGSNGQDQTGQNGHSKSRTGEPYPYDTEPEPGNPTVMPKELLSRFHFAFLIRDPHFSVPSYYRCTIPPLDDVTGFYTYDPLEAGYDEVRRVFDYLRREGLVGPHIATREQDANELLVVGELVGVLFARGDVRATSPARRSASSTQTRCSRSPPP
jgi:hypothetical protein